MDRALDRFPNKNRTFEFRIQTRARSETNNYKSLWIALLIYFWKQINVLIPSLQSSLEKVFRCKSYSNIFNSIFILELWSVSKNRIQKWYLCSESKTRARSETNNYKSLWIALLIGFQIRIELLNLESKPERDLKQIIIKVFGSRSWSVSK